MTKRKPLTAGLLGTATLLAFAAPVLASTGGTAQAAPAAGLCTTAPATTTVTTDPSPLSMDPYSSASFTDSGTFAKGATCATMTLPASIGVKTQGSYPMYEKDGDASSPRTGTMVVKDNTITFYRDPAYAASHPDNATFSGTVTFGANVTQEQIVTGTNITLQLPGQSVPVTIHVNSCPECNNAPDQDSQKWSDLDDKTGVIDTGVVLGTNQLKNFIGQTCTVSDDFTSPGMSAAGASQTLIGADFEYRPWKDDSSVIADNLPAPTYTFTPEAGKAYALHIRVQASGNGPFKDTGTLVCNGTTVGSISAQDNWHDGKAHGSGTTTPPVKPKPPVTPKPTTKTISFRVQDDRWRMAFATDVKVVNQVLANGWYDFREDVVWNKRTNKITSAPLWDRRVNLGSTIRPLTVTVPTTATPAQVEAAEAALVAKTFNLKLGRVAPVQGKVFESAYLIYSTSWDNTTSWKVGPTKAGQKLLASAVK